MKKKKILIVVCALIVILALVFIKVRGDDKEKYARAASSNLYAMMIDDTIEYNSGKIDSLSLVQINYDEDKTNDFNVIANPQFIDTSNKGKVHVTYTLTAKDIKYNQPVKSIMEADVIVE